MADRLPMTPEEIAKVDELWDAIEKDDFFSSISNKYKKVDVIDFCWCERGNTNFNNIYISYKDNKFKFGGCFWEDIFADNGNLDEEKSGAYDVTGETYDTVEETINRLKQIKAEAEDVAWHGLRAY